MNVNQGVLASRDYRTASAKSSAGGFFGEISSYADVKISDCFVNGDIKASTMTQSVRNIVASYAGGFVGLIENNSNLSIENSYAAGTVDSRVKKWSDMLPSLTAHRYAGGLVGRKDDSNASASSSYRCNKLIWVGSATEHEYTLGAFRALEDMRNTSLTSGLNTGNWNHPNNSWPKLNSVNWTPVLDSVLAEIIDPLTFSNSRNQNIAEACIQLGGVDAYFPSAIESKLLSRAEFDGCKTYQYDACNFLDWVCHIAPHAIADKMVNGKTIVVIAIMGTGMEVDGLGAWGKLFSDLRLGYIDCDDQPEHKGYKVAEQTIWKHLMVDDGSKDKMGYLERRGINPSDPNVIFLVTGHSRGAAVANLLSANLNNTYINKDRVFNYNFAPPYVVAPWALTDPYNIDPHSANYDNIFNICNNNDYVTHVPFDKLEEWTSYVNLWSRYGVDIIFNGVKIEGVAGGNHRAELYQKWVYETDLSTYVYQP